MDYIVNINNEQILIENEQREVKKEVVQDYKECRKKLKLTQVELAQRTGISQPNITRFESGNYNPSLEMLIKIAAAMNKKVTIKLEDYDE